MTTDRPQHLTIETSDRGFDRMPTIPSAYGGHVAAYESSGASAAYLWLKVRAESGNRHGDAPTEAHAHLTVEDALRVADQLVRLVADHYQYANSVDIAGDLGQIAERVTEEIGEALRILTEADEEGEPS